MKQNVEQEDSEVLIGLLADGFFCSPEYIRSLRVDYAEFLHYMQTLVNPFNSTITLKGAVKLFNEEYYDYK